MQDNIIHTTFFTLQVTHCNILLSVGIMASHGKQFLKVSVIQPNKYLKKLNLAELVIFALEKKYAKKKMTKND